MLMVHAAGTEEKNTTLLARNGCVRFVFLFSFFSRFYSITMHSSKFDTGDSMVPSVNGAASGAERMPCRVASLLFACGMR
jgi:hypothetical protein